MVCSLVMQFLEWKNVSGQTDGESCTILNRTYTRDDVLGNDEAQESNHSARITCPEFAFSNEVFDTTITSEWGLVCYDEYKKGLTQSLYFLGQVAGK